MDPLKGILFPRQKGYNETRTSKKISMCHYMQGLIKNMLEKPIGKT